MFTIYHGAPDCLPDDKGSYIAAVPFFFLARRSPSGPFLFCGNACVPAHNFQMSCGALSHGHLSYLRVRYYRGLLSRASVNLFKVKGLYCRAARQLGELTSRADLF